MSLCCNEFDITWTVHATFLAGCRVRVVRLTTLLPAPPRQHQETVRNRSPKKTFATARYSALILLIVALILLICSRRLDLETGVLQRLCLNTFFLLQWSTVHPRRGLLELDVLELVLRYLRKVGAWTKSRPRKSSGRYIASKSVLLPLYGV